MFIQDFIQKVAIKTGYEVKKSGTGFTAHCPSHDDSSPSLSISEGNNGRVLIHCFSGCSPEMICASLGIGITDLFPEQTATKAMLERHQTEYPYLDEEGKQLFAKIRLEPGFNNRPKSFYWERLNQHGESVKSIEGCRRVLYRLPSILEAIREGKAIFLVEGEKDADKLAISGLMATTAPESLKWHEEFTAALQNADVVILYDMDKTGLERRDLLTKTLYGKVKRLKVIDLPGIQYQESHGKDISDWLAEGNTTQHLLEIVNKTPDYAPQQPKEGIQAVTIDEFLNMELPKREMLLSPFLPSQGLCLLYAKRGIGKTHVALGIAYAVATGCSFLRWHAPQPKRVLYIDGEMPAASMQERLRRIVAAEDVSPPEPSFLRLITPDLQERAMPDLSKKEGREALEELIKNSDLIIIDNISTLCRSGDENEADSWQPIQDWALSLRRQGKSILFVHHAAKTGQQRGTSKREDVLDAVITLKPLQGHSPDKGAAFEVTFEKTRHFSGDSAASFQVRQKEQNDGLWIWEIADSSNVATEVAEVANMTREGLTIEQISRKLSLTKSQVETRQKKAKEQGLI